MYQQTAAVSEICEANCNAILNKYLLVVEKLIYVEICRGIGRVLDVSQNTFYYFLRNLEITALQPFKYLSPRYGGKQMS